MNDFKSLPIDAIEDDFNQQLSKYGQLIIHADPGAGKSTRLPLWLLNHHRCAGKKTYLIQPRRLAASNIAHYLSSQLGERLGVQIGLRTRYETHVSKATRLEVMTEGVFLRMIQSDPELKAVSCVVFDEFHERSLSLDLGLALCLQSQQFYRDSAAPLSIIIMSATLAADQLSSRLSDAHTLRSEGRCYPVATHYYPLNSHHDLSTAVSKLLMSLIDLETGSLLVFLPGMHEIRLVEKLLAQAGLASGVKVYPLHGSLSDIDQRAAVQAVNEGDRKIVLTTNIAETSITIEGVSVVVDSGLSRVPYFNNRNGMSELRTQRISKASAEQRRGRAGRTGPGSCYRLWSKESHHSLYDYEVPAIEREDISSFMLELAQWGEADTDDLVFLDMPSDKVKTSARQLLVNIGAINEHQIITARGRLIVKLGLHPRLAAMCIEGKRLGRLAEAALLATVLTEPDIDKHNRNACLYSAIQPLFHSDKSRLKQFSLNRIKKLAKQLARRIDRGQLFELRQDYLDDSISELLLQAFPDRIAKRRDNNNNRYILANGQSLQLHPEDSLSQSDWLLVTDSGASSRVGQEPYIHQAIALSHHDIETSLLSRTSRSTVLNWDDSIGAFVAREKQQLGAIVVYERPIKPNREELLEAMLRYVAKQGLSCLDTSLYRQLVARVDWAGKYAGFDFIDISEGYLLARLGIWLRPYLIAVKTKSGLSKINVGKILLDDMTWEERQKLEQLAPSSFHIPTGEQRHIDYCRLAKPVIAARVQEFYGLKTTPSIGSQSLLVELLSPANRPLQLTDDLVGFWAGSYHEMAKQMRGRYPKHYWPIDPANARATSKTKKHMN